ncbi:ribonucleoside-triphosphate reductase, adenosylcobalamin-dependent [Candidatus Synechococcus calcipolaris G9]|uniref:Ribonucleoside-triphosphate reductase, adenosylcobalamin-dependent n=1 Tax=Candidatus Synechococcus calcipolaris G9 TaxID=1497997 RepID=A0ABT6EX75_9SYNE|nr:ribonucleoside-triphosphate reductase, adenosylcobalamin-dependent [Candidatus Synechococcus calcipolaris]MDG2990405.1 ribonucleoside-triphosphate reductase, adenosylcobalamin-dependent [Candidatus Synechococcus calcipolaris G9]
MVQELSPSVRSDFPEAALTAHPVFYRTYSRQDEEGQRESWQQVCDRTIRGLAKLGKLTPAEIALLEEMQQNLIALPSGRWLWVGGTPWVEKPENFSGAYNCTSTNVIDWKAFGLMMDLAMQGCGTGAVLEPKYIDQLPVIRNPLEIEIIGNIGQTPPEERQERTTVTIEGNHCHIKVGDSRPGWVRSYQTVLELSSDEQFTGQVHVTIDMSDIRPTGERLKGFGGVANPVKLPELYQRCGDILNRAIGRKLTAVECCLLIDEAAVVVVAGNVRRCLPEDALVHTSKGLVPIKAVQIGDWVQTPLGFRPVTDKFDQGYQDVYEIETNATVARATLNHRIATLANAQGEVIWKSVQDLQANDRLLHNRQVLPGSITHLPPDFTHERPENSRNASEITIPELTPDIAWLLGLTHGDGYVSLGRNKYNKPFGAISWAYNSLEPQLAEQIHGKINRALALFGVQSRQHLIAGENTFRSRVTSIRLTEYFYRYIKQPKQPLRVPDFILQGTVDVRCAYLAGLMDSDGSAHGRPPYLLTTVYRDFAREVGVLLSSLGIAARLSITEPQLETWQPKYNLKLPALKSRYNSLIAPHSLKGEIRQGLKAHGFTIPGVMMRETYTYSQMRDMGFEGNRTTDSNYERYIAESDITLDIPITVKGLGSYDHVQTYDIEVAEAHCFYCDGYLTHNSAGMRQGDSNDQDFAQAKQNLWRQDEQGNWSIDPERDALRMANHTRVFHRKPTLEECMAAVRTQYYSGEGAIQWAGETIARANADILRTPELKGQFIQAYEAGQGADFLQRLVPEITPKELNHCLGRYGLNPCGEIVSADFHCNLSEIHLNQIDPGDRTLQAKAFKAGALSVASLLHHQFVEDRYRYSRQVDPIVGVSFTGLFDFFVHAFGVEWLKWWQTGRSDTPQGKAFKEQEADYLRYWRDIVHKEVWDYCDRHGLKRPNRCTTVQPSGTKSLLTGASPGWHPPKAQRFIRRITFRKNDPVALACYDYGYAVIPSQSDKDETGKLLDDPFDPRCSEWLVEIPIAVSWADLPGASEIDINQFSALAQFDFYMQVQQHYTTHNTSATVELREQEIEPLAQAIYETIQQDHGYISAALLARFDALETFPRLPFEPISKERYDAEVKAVQQRKRVVDFHQALARYTQPLTEAGPAGCDSDKCLL